MNLIVMQEKIRRITFQDNNTNSRDYKGKE